MGAYTKFDWVVIIILLSALWFMHDAEACGDNVTPDPTPNVPWPTRTI